jgi:hypothetical protein
MDLDWQAAKKLTGSAVFFLFLIVCDVGNSICDVFVAS